MTRSVGTSNRKSSGVPVHRCDAFVMTDDTIELQFHNDSGEKRVVVVPGDIDMLLDMASQLIGAAQTVHERREIRSMR